MFKTYFCYVNKKAKIINMLTQDKQKLSLVDFCSSEYKFQFKREHNFDDFKISTILYVWIVPLIAQWINSTGRKVKEKTSFC